MIPGHVVELHFERSAADRGQRPADELVITTGGFQQRIRAEEDKLACATPEQRALIEEASVTLRKARAVAEVDITLRRRENGEDAQLKKAVDTLLPQLK